MKTPTYSVIVPVYNRPGEVEELLLSLTRQRQHNFEVLIVDDGSAQRSDSVVDKFRGKLDIQYFFKQNSGPGPTRNYGAGHARGTYLVFFDSDCILPEHYFEAVEDALAKEKLDAWGGPDRPTSDFTLRQRAMGYTMSSFLTTGGIRGGKRHMGWFQPRSFNMGISRAVFEQLGGFAFDRLSEDIELSIRLKKAGFKSGLIADAYVYHKRRTTFSQFYRQVWNFGKGRALVGRRHPGEVKLTHWFPTLFVAAVIALPFIYLFAPRLGTALAAGLVFYLAVIFIHALMTSKNVVVAFLSIIAAIVQLWGYGVGFVKQWMKGPSTSSGTA
ncbi:MAG TPA: glycosyltransferase [Cyclobacteriaceae bacterium]|jgi:glycosyltransferase involved in cell wall biosynthesis|nr:MAG: glycosyltransferase [Bacteroidota bacterium]